jgi:hypothetical protein
VSSEPGQDLEADAIDVLFGNPDTQLESGVGAEDDLDGLWDKDDVVLPPQAEDEEEHGGSQPVRITLLFCRPS